jgi:uncharacterized protein YdbL (DUF1318 family)
MRRRVVFAMTGLACLTIGFLAVRAMAAPKVGTDDKELMRKKLTHGQAILEGLSLENLELVKKSAEELSLISLESQWLSAHSPRYNQLATQFRAETETVAQMAGAGNLEGATLGYVRVVTSCVECHKVVRGAEKTAQAR